MVNFPPFDLHAHRTERRRVIWEDVSEHAQLAQEFPELACKVVVSTEGAASCESCRALEGREWTPAEFLREMPIPNPYCTHVHRDGTIGVCRCVALCTMEP